MATLWHYFQKGIKKGFRSASDLTVKYTRIGRIKINILSIKKEIEEKFIELGGRIYHIVTDDNMNNILLDDDMKNLINEINILEREMKDRQKELDNIENENSTK